jgi:hypothetical protein
MGCPRGGGPGAPPPRAGQEWGSGSAQKLRPAFLRMHWCTMAIWQGEGRGGTSPLSTTPRHATPSLNRVFTA